MAVVGDLVEVPSKKVGQAPREGVVVAVSGGLLRIRWSSGEESTLSPSMGSLMVVGRARARGAKKAAKKAAATAKKAEPAPARTSATKAVAPKGPAGKPTSTPGKGSSKAKRRK